MQQMGEPVANQFLPNVSPEWLESQYLLWKESPEVLGPEWQAFFQGFELAGRDEGGTSAQALKQSAVQSLIYRYRNIGHLMACTDPLTSCREVHPLLDLPAVNLTSADLERTYHTRRFFKKSATLNEILEVLHSTYCGSIGVEFMHIQDPGERQWLIDRMEPVGNRPAFSRKEKLRILRKLQEAALFETFLQRKFVGQKRFSLEGGEVLIPLLDFVVQKAASLGTHDLVLGMSHRGRLNVLVNICGKPLENLFAEFEDNIEHQVVGEGDVKYHRGFSADLKTADGASIHVTLASNPSHLESVDPVVEGKCRARQEAYGEGGVERVLPVLMHGDAAFSGQGIVAEVLNLSQLEGFSTGGTLHIVLNNQIGFTTLPENARSTLYATDVAKMLMVPIFHVHGDDPEAVVHVAGLALDYRKTFGCDVILEILCYRRQGHSEGDEPYFTQPLMYEKIKDHPPVHEIYADRLRSEGVTGEEIEAMAASIERRLEEAAEQPAHPEEKGFHGRWSGIEREYRHPEVETAVSRGILLDLGCTITSIPENFHPHPKIDKLMQRRREAIEAGDEIDWGTGESLAFATLLNEGTPVRLSGQDSRRGTFSHRHSTLFDRESGEACVPLSAAARNGAALHIYDSMLSEAAVLGFEYGYSLETPFGLTIWEAQFGDFANGAQVIIDQFIVSSRTKWDRASGLVLLLPHGYEGQGAEHSSARIERYLQACADDNIQVVNPSTPAQFFHLLRRQVKLPFRRPLVVFTPKSLLRLPACRSDVAALASGHFDEVLASDADPQKVRSLLVCSGKIYYELLEKRDQDSRDDVAIIRIEQLYPLRTDLLREAVEPYDQAETLAWVQEEPANMGAWSFLRQSLMEAMGSEPRYVGRAAAAAPAVGSHRQFKEEQERIVTEAFKL
jgi:2-oxoglutarate dehydrogenase E1 component